VLKGADADLEARKNAVTALEIAYPGLKESLDAYLATARQSPVLREKIDEKYSLILETLLRGFHGKYPAEIRDRIESLRS